MFGYVKAHKPELKMREYEAYCSAYCGLCRAMKKTTGALSCVTLNYDFVFLCLVRTVIEHEPMRSEMRRCLVHPLKKRPMLALSPTLSYTARASAELSYYKAADDTLDSSRAKRIALKLLFPFFKHIKKCADLPELETQIVNRLEALSKLEEEGCASIDAPAQLFGEVLGEVFSYGLEGCDKTLAYEIGFHTGRFVYAADAADDYESDIRHGTYNPLVRMHGEQLSTENKESIKTALCLELAQLERAVALVDFSSHTDAQGIINNIIYLGMPEVMNNALYKQDKRIRGDKSKK